MQYVNTISCYVRNQQIFLTQNLVTFTDMERAIIRDLVCRVLQFLPQLTKAVNFAAELDWYRTSFFVHKIVLINLLTVHGSNVFSLLHCMQYFVISYCCSPKQLCEAHLSRGLDTRDTKWEVSINAFLPYLLAVYG
jgi:hypothetical protein